MQNWDCCWIALTSCFHAISTNVCSETTARRKFFNLVLGLREAVAEESVGTAKLAVLLLVVNVNDKK